MSPEIKLTVDGSEAERELDTLQQRALETGSKVLDISHRAYESIVIIAELTGKTIPKLFNIMAEFAFMAGRIIMTTAQAQMYSPYSVATALLETNFALWLFAAGLEAEEKGRQV